MTILMNIYGTKKQMFENSNAVYKVTTPEGRKKIYYMFNRMVTTNSKWLNSKKVPKGWYCVSCPTDDNYIDKCIYYEYPEFSLGDIEHTWFYEQLGVKNYQQIKYSPIVIDTNDSDSDYEEDYEEVDHESDDNE